MDGNIIRPVTEDELVEQFLCEARERNGQFEFAINGIPPEIIHILFSFIELLTGKYDGCAKSYSDHVMTVPAGVGLRDHIRNLVNELAEINGIKIALASNFLKDSQVGHIDQDRPLEEQLDCVAVNFVKPDMHVARFMLCLTDRSPLPPTDELITKPLRTKQKREGSENLYLRTVPSDGWNQNPMDPSASWRIIHDVMDWAENAGVTPLELDRLMFMAGSGKFGRCINIDPRNVQGMEGSPKRMKKNQRYRAFLQGTDALP